MGLEKLLGFKVKHHIDEAVRPVAQNDRIPFHMREDLEAQIAKDEELGVIEKPSGHTGLTPCVSSVVCVPKKSGIDQGMYGYEVFESSNYKGASCNPNHE